MPRTARASVGNMCYHAINRGNAGAEVFHKEEDYVAFLKLMWDANQRLPMRVLAYCLMPNQNEHAVSSAFLGVSASVLPEWLQFFSKFSPATYTLEGMRTALLHGTSLTSMFSTIILPLLVLGIVLIPLGIIVFNRAEKYAMKTGKLKRDG